MLSSYDIGAIAAGFLVNAIFGILSYWKSSKNAEKLKVLTDQTNGISASLATRNDALLKVTASSEHAKGVLEGAAEERKKSI
jgi:hypothetical protein